MAHFDSPGVGVTSEDIARHRAKQQRQAKRLAAAEAEAIDFQWRRELTLRQEREARAAEASGQVPEVAEYERYQKPHRDWRPPCPGCIGEGVEPAPHEGKGLCRRHYQRQWAKANRPGRAKPKSST